MLRWVVLGLMCVDELVAAMVDALVAALVDALVADVVAALVAASVAELVAMLVSAFCVLSWLLLLPMHWPLLLLLSLCLRVAFADVVTAALVGDVVVATVAALSAPWLLHGLMRRLLRLSPRLSRAVVIVPAVACSTGMLLHRR